MTDDQGQMTKGCAHLESKRGDQRSTQAVARLQLFGILGCSVILYSSFVIYDPEGR